MSNIIKVIERLPGLCKLKPATEVMISNAELRLGKPFAEEYRQYLAKYGAISANGVELTGISDAPYLDVVAVTQRLKEYNDVPMDFYVVEDTSVDGIVVWQNTKGEIYLSSPGAELKKIANSLADYLKKR